MRGYRRASITRAAARAWERWIERFGQATGVPVTLNTSFNLRGEPIVNTPQEAYSTFQRSRMDALVLGNCFIRKDASHA